MRVGIWDRGKMAYCEEEREVSERGGRKEFGEREEDRGEVRVEKGEVGYGREERG